MMGKYHYHNKFVRVLPQLTFLCRGVCCKNGAKIVTTPHAGKDVGELDHSYVADGNEKWNHSGKHLAISLKTKPILTNSPVIIFLCISREMKTIST